MARPVKPRDRASWAREIAQLSRLRTALVIDNSVAIDIVREANEYIDALIMVLRPLADENPVSD